MCANGRTRSLVLSSLLVFALAVLPAGASAAAPTPVEPIELGKWRAKGEIVDTILPPGIRAHAAAAHKEEFVDVGGHVITVTTDIPALDLMPYAQVIAWLIHYDEIEDVTLEVVAPDQIAEICGAESLGCYQPEDPGRSPRGWIWIPSYHEDLIHIIVHEYGHHVDNQVINLAHLDMGCDFGNDGSRNWFFERDADDRLLDAGISCSRGGEWGDLLGELYAEDYTWLNGNRFWRPDMRVRAPADWHLEALASDLAARFEPRVRRNSGWIEHRGSRVIPLKLDHWTFFRARLSGRRAANLDLYLRKANARRALERRRGSGSREEIERVLAPGRYEVEIFASADGGNGTLKLFLE